MVDFVAFAVNKLFISIEWKWTGGRALKAGGRGGRGGCDPVAEGWEMEILRSETSTKKIAIVCPVSI